MIFAIDIGNTTTTFGLLDGTEPLRSSRISTTADRSLDELATAFLSLLDSEGVEPAQVSAVSICSVVPDADSVVAGVARSVFGVEPFFLTAQSAIGIPVVYDKPEEVGADRIANALAALKLFGCPSVVVDFGTATTFDVVSGEGEYLGGVIVPGIAISSEQLFKRTAKLPMVSIEIPAHVIGRNTVESIQSGLFYGTLGAVNEILKRIRTELGSAPKVIYTGGYAALISPHVEPGPVVDADLTLKGLAIAVIASGETS